MAVRQSGSLQSSGRSGVYHLYLDTRYGNSFLLIAAEKQLSGARSSSYPSRKKIGTAQQIADIFMKHG
jgi:hypothetical protein